MPRACLISLSTSTLYLCSSWHSVFYLGFYMLRELQYQVLSRRQSLLVILSFSTLHSLQLQNSILETRKFRCIHIRFPLSTTSVLTLDNLIPIMLPRKTFSEYMPRSKSVHGMVLFTPSRMAHCVFLLRSRCWQYYMHKSFSL